MKRNPIVLISISVLLLLTAVITVLNAGGAVKEPDFAGAFYPAEPTVLSGMVKQFIDKAAPSPEEGRLIAVITPHAGYQYSGQVAGYAYRNLGTREINTVILIGSIHQSAFTGASVYDKGDMRTPLGKVRVNGSMARSLIDEKAGVRSSPVVFDKEHALEVQLPFLQATLKDFTIVPILMGQPTREMFSSLSRNLAAILRKDPKAILVVSTDLSHYHAYDKAKSMDSEILDAVTRMSIEGVEQLLYSGQGEMCGGYPVLVAMAAARQLGATHGVLYNHANSGDVTPDRSRVVGYASIGLYKGRLADAEKKELLELAKQTINNHVRNGRTPEYKTNSPRLRANGATFVTINRNGHLRGCIGNIEPNRPLYQSVMGNAVSASSRDPRFPPMTEKELKDISVEVTVLSPLERLLDVNSIKIGTHGLLLVKGSSSGLLLPQVADEYKWDVPTFLEQVSLKAGLPKDAWKDAELHSFTADIIK